MYRRGYRALYWHFGRRRLDSCYRWRRRQACILAICTNASPCCKNLKSFLQTYITNEDEVARGIQSFEQQTGYILASRKRGHKDCGKQWCFNYYRLSWNRQDNHNKRHIESMTSLGQDVFASNRKAAKRMSEMQS